MQLKQVKMVRNYLMTFLYLYLFSCLSPQNVLKVSVFNIFNIFVEIACSICNRGSNYFYSIYAAQLIISENTIFLINLFA